MIRKAEKSHGVQYNRISPKGATRSFAVQVLFQASPTQLFGLVEESAAY